MLLNVVTNKKALKSHQSFYFSKTVQVDLCYCRKDVCVCEADSTAWHCAQFEE